MTEKIRNKNVSSEKIKKLLSRFTEKAAFNAVV